MNVFTMNPNLIEKNFFFGGGGGGGAGGGGGVRGEGGARESDFFTKHPSF